MARSIALKLSLPAAFLALSVSLVSITPCCAADSLKLTAGQLSALLRDPSIKVSATSTVVSGNGPSVTVLADEKERATDQDLKIDAIFLSKALVDGAPGQIETVKILYSQPGKESRFISISARELNDYGSGKITAPQLLSLLRFFEVEAEKPPEVQPGPQVERRLLVWRRIEKLKKEGTGVKPFESLFADVEASAKAGEADKVETKVAFLESKLTDQEEQLKLARKAARGGGVPARAASDHNGAGTGAPVASGAAGGYIPPEAEGLKAMFRLQADDVVRDAEGKNGAEGRKLKDLKIEIDKLFASKQDSAGFALLHQFQTSAAKIIGYEPFGPPNGGGGGQHQGGGNQAASNRNQPAVWGRTDTGSQGGGGPMGGGGGPMGGGGGPMGGGGGPPFGPGGGGPP